MFSIQKSFENSLRSGNDLTVNSPKNRKNPEQHKNCTGKIHGTGKYEKDLSKFCDKSLTKKSKSASLSSENCSDTDESKKSETDSVKVENCDEDEGIWIAGLQPRTKNEKTHFEKTPKKSLPNIKKLTPVKENENGLVGNSEKNKQRKFSSPAKLISNSRYGNVVSRVGSFRKKKLVEISFDEISNLALRRKSRKISETGNFLDLEELIKNCKNSKVIC